MTIDIIENIQDILCVYIYIYMYIYILCLRCCVIVYGYPNVLYDNSWAFKCTQDPLGLGLILWDEQQQQQ